MQQMQTQTASARQQAMEACRRGQMVKQTFASIRHLLDGQEFLQQEGSSHFSSTGQASSHDSVGSGGAKQPSIASFDVNDSSTVGSLPKPKKPLEMGSSHAADQFRMQQSKKEKSNKLCLPETTEFFGDNAGNLFDECSTMAFRSSNIPQVHKPSVAADDCSLMDFDEPDFSASKANFALSEEAILEEKEPSAKQTPEDESKCSTATASTALSSFSDGFAVRSPSTPNICLRKTGRPPSPRKARCKTPNRPHKPPMSPSKTPPKVATATIIQAGGKKARPKTPRKQPMSPATPTKPDISVLAALANELSALQTDDQAVTTLTEQLVYKVQELQQQRKKQSTRNHQQHARDDFHRSIGRIQSSGPEDDWGKRDPDFQRSVARIKSSGEADFELKIKRLSGKFEGEPLRSSLKEASSKTCGGGEPQRRSLVLVPPELHHSMDSPTDGRWKGCRKSLDTTSPEQRNSSRHPDRSLAHEISRRIAVEDKDCNNNNNKQQRKPSRARRRTASPSKQRSSSPSKRGSRRSAGADSTTRKSRSIDGQEKVLEALAKLISKELAED